MVAKNTNKSTVPAPSTPQIYLMSKEARKHIKDTVKELEKLAKAHRRFFLKGGKGDLEITYLKRVLFLIESAANSMKQDLQEDKNEKAKIQEQVKENKEKEKLARKMNKATMKQVKKAEKAHKTTKKAKKEAKKDVPTSAALNTGLVPSRNTSD
jgi:hypothetical protein